MALTIDKPPNPAKVKAGAICVQGESVKNEQGSIAVRAKVYHGQETNPPASPPSGAIAGTAGETYGFTSVSGALSTYSEPYPENTVVVWVSYPGNPNAWDRVSLFFGGKSDTKTNCEE